MKPRKNFNLKEGNVVCSTWIVSTRPALQMARKVKTTNRSQARKSVRSVRRSVVCMFLLHFAPVSKCLFWYAVNRQISLCAHLFQTNVLLCPKQQPPLGWKCGLSFWCACKPRSFGLHWSSHHLTWKGDYVFSCHMRGTGHRRKIPHRPSRDKSTGSQIWWSLDVPDATS